MGISPVGDQPEPQQEEARRDLRESVQEAVREALQHAENRGFNHELAGYTHVWLEGLEPHLGLPFDHLEIVTLMEYARVAMADADILDGLAENLDLADAFVVRLRDKLQAWLDKKSPPGEL